MFLEYIFGPDPYFRIVVDDSGYKLERIKEQLSDMCWDLRNREQYANDYDEFRARFLKDGLNVVTFGTSGCKPCRRMKKEVYGDREYLGRFKEVNWVNIVLDRGDNRKYLIALIKHSVIKPHNGVPRSYIFRFNEKTRKIEVLEFIRGYGPVVKEKILPQFIEKHKKK